MIRVAIFASTVASTVPYLLLAASLAGPSALGCSKGHAADAAPAESQPIVTDPIVGRRVDVVINGKGFVPNNIEVKKGEATTIVFTRTTPDTCATAVVFPDLKITRQLPLKVAIAINMPVDQARTLGFECGMGMYKSTVVVQ